MIRRRSVVVMAVSATAAVGVVLQVHPVLFARSATDLPLAPRVETPLAVSSDGDFGDPFVLAIPTSSPRPYRYVVYATANWDQRVPTATSNDLRSWVDGPDALPALPAWALPDPGLRNAWGPAVIALAGRYVMYYSTRTLVGMECISAATADNPLGPFVDSSTGPLVCQQNLGGSIDPSPVLLADGTFRLLWRSLGGRGRDPAIWSQPLTGDGLGVSGQATLLLRPQFGWEGGVVEGPSMMLEDGRWWLFFSANSYRRTRYATGIASCRSPSGPCATSPRPLLRTTSTLLGPGGLEAFRGTDGRLWAVFHTWRLPSEGNPHEREIHVAPLN